MLAALLGSVALASAGARPAPLLRPPSAVALPALLASTPLGRARARPARMCDEPSQKDVGLGAKAAWFAAEAFGKLAAAVNGKSQPALARGDAEGPLKGAEIEARLRADWDRQYFISGNIDLDLYETDCEVSCDPTFQKLRTFNLSARDQSLL